MPAFKLSPVALALVALCVLTGGAALLHTDASRASDQPAAAQPRPALTVTTAQPQRTSVPQRLSANGNVAAWQEASVGAESNGLRLTAVNVNVGDVVKAGQVLATFAGRARASCWARPASCRLNSCVVPRWMGEQISTRWV